MAEVEGVYAYSVLEESFWEHWERLPAATRGKAEALTKDIEAAMRRKAAKKGGGEEEQSQAAIHAAESYPLANDRATADIEAQRREIASEREETAAKLERFLALPAEERLHTVAEAAEEFGGVALAQALIEESWSRMPGSPLEALSLAELTCAVLDNCSWSAIVVELYARATAHMANALRATGQLCSASRLFRAARFLLRYGGGGDRLVLAEMDYLEGVLLRGRRCFEDAQILLERSVHAYRAEGQPALAARSLLDLGILHQELQDGHRAAEAAGEALRILDPEAEPRLCFIARHNRADGLCAQGKYEAARRLLAENEEFARRYGDPLSLLRIAWVEGKISRGLGELEAAESSFLVARHGFLKHAIAYDAAVVSLELALLYLGEGRTTEVKGLASEMVEFFEQQEVHREASAAVQLFRQAVEQEQLSVALVERMSTYLTQSRSDPSLSFSNGGGLASQ